MMRWIPVVAAMLAGCGGAPHGSTGGGEAFACRDRSASYMAVKDIGGDERGVLIECADAGPRIKRWRQEKGGKRDEEVRPMSPAQFNKTWDELAGTGWENLKDCDNGTLGKHDPVYVFDIKDDENKASFQCQTREVPYPYFDITNALDLAANQGHKQLGDDEPADVKALDKKDKNR
ncbi:MAG: hypothetical protein ACM31C_06705 [Acidobacteriota bacterium]